MTKSEKQLRAALTKIAEVSSSAVGADDSANSESADEAADAPAEFEANVGCSVKMLPTRLLEKAAKTAITINPANGLAFGPVANALSDDVLSPQALTVLVAKYWGPTPRKLTVSFMEPTELVLKQRILSHMNAWSTRICISFVLVNGTGQVRISRGPGGYWSYLGTDILQIPANRPTMNLQGFSMNTPESEFKRVVRHETGHTLGFPHEHMRKELVERIDPPKAYAYFLKTQGWPKSVVDAQVLTPLNQASIFGTPADQTSIMCYQLPGSIMKNGQAIPGGIDIIATDYAFAARIYPKPGFDPGSSSAADDWDAADDVDAQTVEAAIRDTMLTDNGPTDRSADYERTDSVAHA